MNPYSPEEEQLLLTIARRTLTAITNPSEKNREEARNRVLDNLPSISPALQESRACFITLEMRGSGELRGCTGTLVARYPLIVEVAYSTYHTAFFDPRFRPVRAEEIPHIRIEISILTPSQSLVYQGADDLLRKLQPGIDGVTLSLGTQRATFLPQVWERLPQPADFLDALCHKMGVPPNTWRRGEMQVEVYTAIKLIEPD